MSVPTPGLRYCSGHTSGLQNPGGFGQTRSVLKPAQPQDGLDSAPLCYWGGGHPERLWPSLLSCIMGRSPLSLGSCPKPTFGVQMVNAWSQVCAEPLGRADPIGGPSALTNHSHLGIWAEFSQVVMVFKEREVMLAANFGPARVSVDWTVALSPGSHPRGHTARAAYRTPG